MLNQSAKHCCVISGTETVTMTTNTYVLCLKKTELEESNKIYWFSTLREPGNEIQHTIQKRLVQELIALQVPQLLFLQNNQKILINFVSFRRDRLNIRQQSTSAIWRNVFEFHNLFAQHWFDIRIKNHFQVKLTPIDESPVYNQILPTSIKFEHIWTNKPNGKSRLLVDLRNIKNLTADDFIKNNHLVSTVTDSTRHMAVEKSILHI